jgi:EthD domain
MIRLTALLRRNPALTPAEFQAHWSGTHARLMRDLPGVEDRVVRYEQHPRLVAPGRWTGTEGVDGMAVQWFRSVDDLLGMVADPDYQRTVAPDEQHLLDLQSSVFLVTDEPRLILPTPS